MAVIAALAVALYFGIPRIRSGLSRFVARWREQPELTFEQRREKQRQYYERLPQPKLSPEQLIARMKKEKGLYDRELGRMVEWYLYDPNSKALVGIDISSDANHQDICDKISEYHVAREKLIRQLVENLHFEVKLSFPEERGGRGFSSIEKGLSCEILRNRYGFLPHINWILYEKLHEYSETDADPHFIYLLLELKKERADGYDRRIRYKDILAFLRIYAKYKDWPSIRKRRIKSEILYYPGEWKDDRAVDEVLELADREGPRPAYELYAKYYKSNYHYAGYIARHSKAPNKVYGGDHIFEIWPGEREVKGTFRFYNVDSDDVLIELCNVVKVHSMVRNGEEITSLCSVNPGGITVVPLKAGEVVEVEYVISVIPDQWERFMFWPALE